MRLKSKVFLVYAISLLASHLWIHFHAPELGFAGLDRSAIEGKALYLLIGRAGGANSEFGALERELGVAENAAIWSVVRWGDSAAVDLEFERLLGLRPASLDVVGIGYGSIEAVRVVETSNAEVRSLNLVEPVVSTRFELLGDPRLNGALKTFQLAWFWVLENAVPHFGYSSLLPYNYETAKLVFDADQDSASASFANQKVPTRIFYKENGGFKQAGTLDAYLSVRPDAKAFSYEQTAEIADEIARSQISFGSRLETAGTARRFEDFPGVRLGPVWASFLLGLSTFASEDFACIGGGLLAASGAVDLWPAIVGCLLGIFFGDLGIYLIGRLFGATALELPVLRHLVSAKALSRSSDWFEKRGVALVVLTRFFPGSRVPTYFAAGVVRVGWIRFTLALLLASAIWTPILVVASFYLGERFLVFFESLGAGGWLGIVAFIICFSVGVRVFAKLASWKGRRLLYGSCQRLVRWEFWPMWAVYAPVIVQIVWLAIRYRSVSLPFSVNPCMPASGLVFESKIQILSHLEKAGVPIARFEAIELELPLEEKLVRLERFMERLGLEYPVVLKPDVGQRGQGVVIARSEADARSFFAQQQEDTIAQEYIGGTEYGVFYQRFANRENGEVTSITDKRTTWVVGDGRSTLEELILRDDRAVCMAAYFLSEYESHLEAVPADGEKFMLASIGTHSRGAVFLDGADLITPELCAEVDRFSRVVEGFHFGRYDLRVPSEEALKRGEGIRVIELNGITSEPTNMYDPRHGPIFGWSSLMRQWRAIFALAKENQLAGHELVSKRYLLRLAIGHFRGLASRDLV